MNARFLCSSNFWSLFLLGVVPSLYCEIFRVYDVVIWHKSNGIIQLFFMPRDVLIIYWKICYADVLVHPACCFPPWLRKYVISMLTFFYASASRYVQDKTLCSNEIRGGGKTKKQMNSSKNANWGSLLIWHYSLIV